MKKRMRVILSCHYFSPFRGGEAAVGWNFANRLALEHEITVVCGDLGHSTPTLDDWTKYLLDHGETPNLEVVYVPPGPFAKFLFRLHSLPGCWFFYYFAYRLWQRNALKTAQFLHVKQAFDLAHQLTIITCREPGYLWKMEIPFFWGPINGAAQIPWTFLPSFGVRGCYRHLTRNVLNLVQTRLARRSRSAARVASKVWTVTREDKELVENVWGAKAEAMVETGATPIAGSRLVTREADKPLRIIWCGIIEARKALHLLIDSLAALGRQREWELHVIGDGPDELACRERSKRLGIADNIQWHGRVIHEKARELIASGDLLAHPALKEGTPHVILEALANGVPILCHDACGMGIVVDECCGLKVPLQSPAITIDGFRSAIVRILDEDGLLEHLSANARERADLFSWENLCIQISNAYRAVQTSD
jgi:glycosyltransferase involved in cell wall biosynthesis